MLRNNGNVPHRYTVFTTPQIATVVTSAFVVRHFLLHICCAGRRNVDAGAQVSA
jgi:hypothetical protein